jgi:hypothetical protein
VTNEIQTPEDLTAARMAAEFRKALIIALDVITWPEIIAIQLDLAREKENDLMECLLEACMNNLNAFYGFSDEGDLT